MKSVTLRFIHLLATLGVFLPGATRATLREGSASPLKPPAAP